MLLKELIDKKNKILVIGAHPDDVEFSSGRLLLRRKGINSYAIVMTDGRKGQDGTPCQRVSEKEYAKVRINETKNALKQLKTKAFFINAPDQDLVKYPNVIEKLLSLLYKINPDYILIPPYEGAHPDHDVTHLYSVIAAMNFGLTDKQIIEYGSYNNYQGKFNIQKFIPNKNKEYVLNPNKYEQKKWNKIMKLFVSQINQQKYYIPQSKYEIFRTIPQYDYTKLPYQKDEPNAVSMNVQNNIKQNNLLVKVHNFIKLIHNYSNIILRQIPYLNIFLSKKDKMFYETWSKINPIQIKNILVNYLDYNVR
jgi:LmbE family N-acetylglucosaminyl deacetylase